MGGEHRRGTAGGHGVRRGARVRRRRSRPRRPRGDRGEAASLDARGARGDGRPSPPGVCGGVQRGATGVGEPPRRGKEGHVGHGRGGRHHVRRDGTRPPGGTLHRAPARRLAWSSAEDCALPLGYAMQEIDKVVPRAWSPASRRGIGGPSGDGRPTRDFAGEVIAGRRARLAARRPSETTLVGMAPRRSKRIAASGRPSPH